MKSIQVAVVGSINMDLVVGCRRMPGPGETVAGHSFKTAPGGKGANQAVAAARFGSRVRMFGCVGADEFGRVLRSALQEESISTDFITRHPEVSSGVALIQLDDTGENAITVVAGANGHVKLTEEMRKTILASDVVLLQMEIPLAVVEEVVGLCFEANVLTVLDPAPVPAAGLSPQLFRVAVLTPNQHEAKSITGIRVHDAGSANEAAQVLQERGASRVVIKMGSQGAFVRDDGGNTTFVPAIPATVVDTTAAGDAFTGVMAVALAEKLPLVKAVQLGCAAGSLAVSKFGAQDAMPAREAVEMQVREFYNAH